MTDLTFFMMSYHPLFGAKNNGQLSVQLLYEMIFFSVMLFQESAKQFGCLLQKVKPILK